MNVELITEHEDGGATYEFDLTPEEADAMCRNGILWAIVSEVTGITIEKAIKMHNEKESKMENRLFDLGTVDVEKFKDVVYITSYITEGTGLTISGMRFDGGVVGFNPPKTEGDYVSYNLDRNILFVNYETLKPTQVWALHGIASMFDLTIKEFNDDA